MRPHACVSGMPPAWGRFIPIAAVMPVVGGERARQRVGPVLNPGCTCRRYSIPFLDRHGTLITSYVAIAPIGVKNWGGPWEDTHKRVRSAAAMGSGGREARRASLFSATAPHSAWAE